MKTNLFNLLVKWENNLHKSNCHIRLVLIAGLVMYSIFGILDFYMLPLTYKDAWIFRFGIVFPLSLFFLLLTYSKNFYKHRNSWLSTLTIIAQIGITFMIYHAKPSEAGYLGYYAGLTLVLLWAVIIFKSSLNEVILISVTNVLFYNVVAVAFQKLNAFPVHSYEFGSFVSNNFFLVSTSILAVLGAFRLNSYKKRLFAHNKILIEKKELAKAKEKAEESERLKSAFLANMSHEIRTPMNAVLGFSELLKNPNLTESKRNEYIDILHSKGNQLLRIINDIVDISKIETNNLHISIEPINLNHLLDEIKLVYEKILKNENKHISVRLFFHKELVNEDSWIAADGVRLKQMISNLLDNAIKFTEKGKIEVSYELIDQDIRFSIKDTGIGIPESYLSIVFERFRQVDNESLTKTGTGLGLSIVKSLVELSGGKIWVESEINKGSCFYFTIPHIKITSSKKQYNDHFKPIPLKWKGKTILIAEDDKDNYKVIREFLSETGATILWAKTGKEVLDMALGERKIDLILMDIKMSGINGYEATRKIKAVKKNLPVIAQTAYAMEDDKRKAISASCDGYISKPIDFNQFMILLDKFLKK